MKKKIAVFGLLIVLVLSLTSCMRVEIDMTIKKSGKADVSMLYAVDESMAGYANQGEDPEELGGDLKEEGWDVEPFNENGYVGYRATKKNIEIMESFGALNEDNTIGSLTKKGSTYVLDLDLFYSEGSDVRESLGMLRNFGGKVIVRITFPSKPNKHNATSVSEDGKTLEWDLLDPSSDGKIHVEYKSGGFLKYALIMSCLTIVVAIIVYLIYKRKRGNSHIETVPSDNSSNNNDR